MPADVIDLFAGPGGLGEGFSSHHRLTDRTAPAFRLALSIEKDPHAHRTLEFRALFRALLRDFSEVPEMYYDYVRGNRGPSRKDLFAAFPDRARAAQEHHKENDRGNAGENHPASAVQRLEEDPLLARPGTYGL